MWKIARQCTVEPLSLRLEVLNFECNTYKKRHDVKVMPQSIGRDQEETN